MHPINDFMRIHLRSVQQTPREIPSKPKYSATNYASSGVAKRGEEAYVHHSNTRFLLPGRKLEQRGPVAGDDSPTESVWYRFAVQKRFTTDELKVSSFALPSKTA